MANSVVLSNYKGTLILNDRFISESEAVAKHNVDETAHQYIQGRIDDLQIEVNGKQDTISDLSTIRSGAEAGATAVQPGSLATVATSGDYGDLLNKPTIPTVNDSTLTIQKNGTDVATFTANSSSNVTANITVPTQASDIGAQPTLVSGTNIKTVNNTSLLGSGNITIDGLPEQTSQSGKFLTTNGTSASWATVDALPSQTGNNGKFLTTNGTTASWSQVVAYPTLTWFTGTTGTALSTTLDLANANLVKVYKNGMLLEDSNSPDAKIIKYTALNAGNRLLINTPFNFSAANTWEIDLKITTVYSSYGLTLIGGVKDYYHPALSLSSGSIKSAYLFISSSGTAWNISNTQYAAGPYYEQQTYTVKASYDGAQYSVYNTNVATQETTGRVTATTTAKQIYDGNNSKITLLGNDSSGNFNGTFYFSDFKIKLDNTVVFDGQTAEEGVDYTNYGCTKTEEYVYDKDYLISNNTINFSTALQATDKITVEVF